MVSAVFYNGQFSITGVIFQILEEFENIYEFIVIFGKKTTIRISDTWGAEKNYLFIRWTIAWKSYFNTYILLRITTVTFCKTENSDYKKIMKCKSLDSYVHLIDHVCSLFEVMEKYAARKQTKPPPVS